MLFPFGHGLSYTTFAYSALRVSSQSFRDVDGILVELDVTNTGAVAGQEVVQVYVHDCAAGVQRPPKELKGFAKVALQPGETQTVAVPLDFRAFAFFHPGYGRWIAEAGEFDILVGASSADLRGAVRVTLQSTTALPSLLGPRSTLHQWLDDPAGRAVIGPIYELIKAAPSGILDTDESTVEIEGAKIAQFFRDMPLPDMLEVLGNALPSSPAAIVDGLLRQVRS